MWGHMWSFGRRFGGGSDPEHEQCIRMDDVKKRMARRWTNQGLEPPSSLLYRETEEYDRRHGRTPSSVGPYGVTLLPMKREWADEPEDCELIAVKMEPKEIARQGIVGPKAYDRYNVDAVVAAIAERSLREEAERCHHDDELEDLVFKQAVAANLAAKDKDD
ncbi:CDPK-related protein kinase [Hordeum vulgare]|nr:CDPK-related protein kinase [Hordeum vulgare]